MNTNTHDTPDWPASYGSDEDQAAYVEARAREIYQQLQSLPEDERDQARAGALWFSSAHCRSRIEARLDELEGAEDE